MLTGTNTLEIRLKAVEDWQAITNLRGQYCHVLDDRNWNALTELFTEDGEFDGLARVQGRAAIHQFFSTTVQNLAEGFWHFCTNGTIDLDGDQASGRISMQYLSRKKGVSYVSAGHYDDQFRRVDGRWRFARRRITFYYFGPLTQGFTGAPTYIQPDGTPYTGMPPHRAD